MSDPIVRAHPVRRRRFLWTLVALAALGAAAIWLLAARLAQGGLGLAQARRLLWSVTALLSLIAAGAALVLTRLAARIFRSGRYPPPGALVLRDTPVRTGTRARALAWLGLTCAALLLTAAVALPLLLLRLLRLLDGG
jgi:hypothetical protein